MKSYTVPKNKNRISMEGLTDKENLVIDFLFFCGLTERLTDKKCIERMLID